jgi:hypothetical protein
LCSNAQLCLGLQDEGGNSKDMMDEHGIHVLPPHLGGGI